MDEDKIWIEEILLLDRPEYAKQPEALLTDLIWRSPGSTLSTPSTGIVLSRDSSLVRLVPRRASGSGTSEIIETIPTAEETDTSTLILNPGGTPTPVKALLNSLLAPKSRGDKSLACVPVHPDAIILQTLHGLVNKAGPPHLARVIETVGWLGGSEGRGHVAQLLLQAMNHPANVNEGFTGLVDTLLSEIADYTWPQLINKHPDPSVSPHWPQVKPSENIDKSLGDSTFARSHQWTPFHWFWNKWGVLCSPSGAWYDFLPTRRFIDWATCLLRSGLSFAYLWEADFFIKLYTCILEELMNRKTGAHQEIAWHSLSSMLRNGAILATIEPPSVPATQKHAWNALRTSLAQGYMIRKRIEDHLSKSGFIFPAEATDTLALVQAWLNSLTIQDLEKLGEPLQVDNNTAVNTREFVRYLLRPRSSDDDKRDQADFYYLARTNSKSFWFQPGPEWLVVVTSLLSGQPGAKCTLGMLLEDLRRLGIRIERRVLVSLLEEAGLSTDSPDADNALIIQAGF